MMNKFSERLRKLREGKKISQKALSEYLGYGATAVSGYENSRNEPSFDTLIQLATYFDVTIDYLIGNEDKPKWLDTLTSSEADLLQFYRGLMPEERELVLALVKALNNTIILDENILIK